MKPGLLALSFLCWKKGVPVTLLGGISIFSGQTAAIPHQSSSNHRAIPEGCLKVCSPGMVLAHCGQTRGCRGEGHWELRSLLCPLWTPDSPALGLAWSTAWWAVWPSATDYFLLDCWESFLLSWIAEDLFWSLYPCLPAQGASCPKDI